MELKSFLNWSLAIALHPPPPAALKNHVHVQAIHLPWLVVLLQRNLLQRTQNLHGSILNWTAQHA
uniref:Uncharacterized protein n=1 Tax=Oryza nivara TaxID=4536 RepID=A0A0E0H2Z2_ORYNI